MTWEEILADGREILRSAGISEYDLDAWYLFETAFGIDRAHFYLCRAEDAGLTADVGAKEDEASRTARRERRMREYSRFKEMLNRRAGRVPLQYILGSQEFMGMEFLVNEHVLIPRQDTEALVEAALAENKNCGADFSVLDMCTGSGCIAVSLAALGRYDHVEAADISEDALEVAEKNAERLLPNEHQVRFRKSDLFSEFHAAGGDVFDLIVSNPPYIPSRVIEDLEPEVRDFEPRTALDGLEDGLFFYRKLAERSPEFLKPKGRIYLEIGYDQGGAVSALLEENGFTEVRIIKDLTGKERVVRGERP